MMFIIAIIGFLITCVIWAIKTKGVSPGSRFSDYDTWDKILAFVCVFWVLFPFLVMLINSL